MKFLLLLLPLSCSIARAQVNYFTYDSAAIQLEMRLPGAEPFDTARKWKRVKEPFIYLGSDHDIYNYFGYEKLGQFRDFDFTALHILGKKICLQCEAVCDIVGGHSSCHRNQCTYTWTWAIRDNSKAFTEAASETHTGSMGISGKVEGRSSGDTVISVPADTMQCAWLTHSSGDCHARFTFSIFRDKYYPVLLLKEWNYYGGCRAAGFWDFTITFRKSEGVQFYIKQEIPADKQR